MSVVIHQGDCTVVMPTLPADSVDAVVTDPPYGIGFMGKVWDGQAIAEAVQLDRETRTDLGPASPSRPGRSAPRSSSAFGNAAIIAGPVRGGSDFQEWCEGWARDAFRVLKPGGHLVAFGGTRTFHRLACAIEDAGFEIRDCLSWLYGSGFPKSLDVSKAIDKAAGALGDEGVGFVVAGDYGGRGLKSPPRDGYIPPTPATEDAQRWEGWGTALKPAWEPIILARKPLSERSVAANVLAHGTGGINVDGCRIGYESGGSLASNPSLRNEIAGGNGGHIIASEDERRFTVPNASGRWPANVVLDEEAAAMLDEQSGERPTSQPGSVIKRVQGGEFFGDDSRGVGYAMTAYGDTGGASRFFYTAKADAAERSEGLGKRNSHPTVKPLALMAWLVKLVTPPGGTVLDPFLGSGTTAIACLGNGFSCIGIEREPEYVEIAEQRIGLGVTVLADNPPINTDSHD
jgi:site-specific DNA-methyltransferase (adenine-specific)